MPPESPTEPPRSRLRPLPGRTPSVRLSRVQGSARLWIGDGEIVQETMRSYTQEIQRFGFADIQAVQIRRTARGVVYNIVLAGVLALTLLITVSIWSADRASAELVTGTHLLVMACISAPFVLLLLINTLRGATCRTVLLTVLGPQHLLSLSRMRQARRALDTIIAGVDAVQGALRPDEAAQQVDQAQTPQRVPGATAAAPLLGATPPSSPS